MFVTALIILDANVVEIKLAKKITIMKKMTRQVTEFLDSVLNGKEFFSRGNRKHSYYFHWPCTVKATSFLNTL